jgi:hypothetical protein
MLTRGPAAPPEVVPTARVDTSGRPLHPDGCSNSRRSDRNCRAGIDTVAIAWTLHAGSDLALALGRAEGFPYPSGGKLLSERDDSGARVMWWPEYSTAKVEGRLSAMLATDSDVHTLAPTGHLQDAPAAAEGVLARLTAAAPAGETAGVRRLDLASERVFEDEREANAFIRAAALLTPSGRYKRDLVLGADGAIETGYVMTRTGRKLLRVYNKTREALLPGPGVVVRVESQNRYPKSRAKTPEKILTENLSTLAVKPWAGYVQQAKEIVVANGNGAIEHLLGAAARGDIGIAKAERMIGTLAVLDRCGRSFYELRQGQRRLADLRSAGVVVDQELAPDRVLPVGQLLREMVSEFEREGV